MPKSVGSELSITVCTTCPAGQAGLAALLAETFGERGVTVRITQVDCMSGCARPSAIAFRAHQKTAYLFGDISSDDLPDIVRFVELYMASPDGNFADARPLGALRLKAIARIPA